MAAQAGLSLAWSETPEDTFCRVVAQKYPLMITKNIPYLVPCLLPQNIEIPIIHTAVESVRFHSIFLEQL